LSDLIERRALIAAAGAGVVARSVRAQADPTHPATAQSEVAADDLVMRKIPKGEDLLPAIGLGTFMTFDLIPGARRDHLLEVTPGSGRPVAGYSTPRPSTGWLK
jgi:hypothetical protein